MFSLCTTYPFFLGSAPQALIKWLCFSPVSRFLFYRCLFLSCLNSLLFLRYFQLFTKKRWAFLRDFLIVQQLHQSLPIYKFCSCINSFCVCVNIVFGLLWCPFLPSTAFLQGPAIVLGSKWGLYFLISFFLSEYYF